MRRRSTTLPRVIGTGALLESLGNARWRIPRRRGLFSLVTVEDRLELDSDGRDVAIHDIADDALINVEVGVGEDHSRPDDLAPRDLGVLWAFPKDHATLWV